ncbi:MAG: MarR family transcriptional regulator [Microlunatus sp.]|nr:MarR family transcriptional regulator [Microlunatus sp.]
MAVTDLESTARKLHPVISRLHEYAAYAAGDSTEELMKFGYRNYWDCYFAARSAPLGIVPPEVVDAVFYNFAPGEVARHIPWVWQKASPEQVLAAHHRGCAAATRRMLGSLADSPDIARAADIATKAATSAPVAGRALYAGLRSLPLPDEPVARLWHAATLLREHRGDGHNAALMAYGIGGLESHVLRALSDGAPAHEDGRIHHLGRARIDRIIASMRVRGLVEESGELSESGRETKQKIESLTDQMAAVAYQALEPAELDQLVADLKPVGQAVDATGY